MSDSVSLGGDFPSRGRDAWEALARAGEGGRAAPERLGSSTADGIELRPLYFREDGLPPAALSFPGALPFARGATASGASQRGWDLRAVRAESSPEDCNRAVLDDLEGGATSIELVVASNGDLAGESRGLRLARLSDLERALEGVRLDAITLALDAGSAFAPAAAALVALARRQGLAPESPRSSRFAFGADPLGALARTGALPQGVERALEELAELATYTQRELPGATTARAAGSPYHDAGASDAEELSCVLATGAAYLRAMTGAGLPIERAFAQLELELALDADVFGGIAKLRSARRLWARVAQECGLSEREIAAAVRIQARASRRMLTSRDPLLNVLRVTTAALAAAAGGAEILSTPAFDEPNGPPSELARRLARNTQLVLAEEAHLHRVIDPAGGSWYVEHRTEALCARAWELFRDLERRGGMCAVLRDGSLARDVAKTAAARAHAVATRRETLVGVNRFVARSEPAPTRARPTRSGARLAGSAGERFEDLVARWASGGAVAGTAESSATRIEPLPLRRVALPFEALRDAADLWAAVGGARPRVFLARLGAARDHDARADWVRDLLATGGLDVGDPGSLADAGALASAFRASGARVAVLCGSDERYQELGEPAAESLRAGGAELVLLAGSLRGASELEHRLRAAGVAELVFEGSDALRALRRIGQVLGFDPELLRDDLVHSDRAYGVDGDPGRPTLSPLSTKESGS